MRRVLDAHGIEWTLTPMGATGAASWEGATPTHAIVVATAGDRTVNLSPAIGWEKLPDEKLIALITDAGYG